MKILFIILLALLTFSGPAMAQPPHQFQSSLCPEIDQESEKGIGGPGNMKGHRERLERFRMVKMLELLELESSKEEDFIKLANEFRQDREQLMSDRADLIHEMSDALHDGKIDGKTSQNFIKQLQALEEKQHLLQSELMTDAAKILTADQLIRLVVFQERFEHHLMERLRGMRGMRGPGGPGGRWQMNDSLGGGRGKRNFDNEGK